MSEQGLIVDPLYAALTRPPLRAGVTDIALVGNVMLTVELYLLTRQLLVLLIAVPIHALAALLCARDARIFELLILWCVTRLPAYARNFAYWHSASYSALSLDPPDLRGRRRLTPTVRAAFRRISR
jgi:type IV secretion system protein VirB3